MLRTFLLFVVLAAPCFGASFPGKSGSTLTGAPVATACTQGFAPCQVTFDATAVTSTATSIPFNELDCRTYFDDASSGTFSYGSGGFNASSKNSAVGCFASHIYTTAGTYNPHMTICDANFCTDTALGPITVSAYTGAGDTACFSHTGVFTNCPTGATHTTIAAAAGDFNTAWATMGANQRILFNGGETWTLNAPAVCTTFGNLVGSYGTGKVKLQYTGSANFFTLSASTSPPNNFCVDMRFVDLEIDGQSSTAKIGWGAAATASFITWLRIDCHDLNNCWNIPGTALSTLNQAGTPTTLTADAAALDTTVTVTSTTNISTCGGNYPCQAARIGNNGTGSTAVTITNVTGNVITFTPGLIAAVCITGSPGCTAPASFEFWALPFAPTYTIFDSLNIQDSTCQRTFGSTGNECFFIESTRFVVQGNFFTDTTAGAENVARSQYAGKGVFANNTFSLAKPNKNVFTLRAPDWGGDPTYAPNTYTQYVEVYANKFIGNSSNVLTELAPKNSGSDQRHRYTVWEYNHYVLGGASGAVPGMSVTSALFDTFRNNLFDMTAVPGTIARRGIAVAGAATTFNPASTNLYGNNNTFYDGAGTASTTRGYVFNAGAVNMFTNSNQCYFPGNTGTSACVNGTATNSNNSSSLAQTPNSGTQPYTVPADFIPTATPPILSGTNPPPVKFDWYGRERVYNIQGTQGAFCAASGCRP